MSEEKIEEQNISSFKKRFLIPIIFIVLIGIVGLQYYVYSLNHVSTDDAFIEGHVVQIAPKVSGIISNVYIDDNQLVNEGDLIAEIDSKDYEVQYNQALAKLETALAKQKGASVNVDLTTITSDSSSGQAKALLEQANHNLNVAQEQVNYAKIDFDRYIKLYSKGIVSKQDFDKVSTSYKVATEKLNVAQKTKNQAIQQARGADTVLEQVSISDSQLKSINAEIKQLKSASEQAKLNLSYTKIYAPQKGIITNKSVEKGAYVQIGQPLLSIVPEQRWIIANFKETQLTKMQVGQIVNIKVDTYPNLTFKGKVDSIQSATGSKASLFPPENAVGSFVKVVQRVPVKIIFTEKIPSKYAIVPGMSVVPEVVLK